MGNVAYIERLHYLGVLPVSEVASTNTWLKLKETDIKIVK